MPKAGLPADFAAKICGGTVEALDDRGRFVATERHHERRCIAKIRADPHFSYRDRASDDIRITQFAALKALRDHVTQFLADPKLTLGWCLGLALGHDIYHAGNQRPGAASRALENPRHFLDLEALDNVTGLDVIVVGE